MSIALSHKLLRQWTMSGACSRSCRMICALEPVPGATGQQNLFPPMSPR
jgi:hypothetical protein